MSIRRGAIGALFALLFTLPLSASAATCVVGTNCIPNPGFETSSGNTATGWSANSDGSGATFSIVTGADAHSGTNAAKVAYTTYTNGSDAKWVPETATVSAGQFYTLTFWYKSSTTTSAFVEYNGGAPIWFKDLPPTTTYQQVTAQILVPSGATTMQLFAELAGIGDITVDDWDLELAAAAPIFSQGLVSLSFDDSLQSFSDNATSSLITNGLTATEYVITGPDGSNVEAPGGNPNGGYMSLSELTALQNAGFEIGAHTRQHVDLVKDDPNAFGYGADTATNRQAMWTGEINGSRTDLTSASFTPVDTFAYPYGSYDSSVETAVKSAGFIAARSVDQGYNYKTTDPYALKMQHVTNTTTAADIESWIDQALSDKTWLILMFHEVRSPADDATVNYPTGASTNLCNDPSNPGSPDPDCTSKDVLDAVAAYLKTKPAGTVITVSAGAKLLTPVVMHTITPSAGTNGSISPNVATQVADGGSTTFSFTPAAGFVVGGVTIDGTATTTANAVTLTNVTADHTIAVTFVSDDTQPTVTLSTTAANPTNATSIPVTATFSKPVTGVSTTTLAVTNGTATSFAAASSTVYTWNIAPTADGPVTFSIASSSVASTASSTLVNAVSNTLSVTSNRTAGVITLTGPAYVNVVATTTPYVDAGATVSGTTTLPVMTGTVNPAVVGTYTITYTYTDSAGNVSTPVTRTVAVTELGDMSDESFTNVTSNSFTVTWTTAASGTSRVVYDTVSHDPITATSTNYGYAFSTTEDNASTTQHSVTITGLTAGTTYYFRAISHGSPDDVAAQKSVTTAGNPAPVTSSGGGGGGGGGPISGSYHGGAGFYYDDQAGTHGSVLGASTSTVPQGNGNGANLFKFLKNLSKGMRNGDVLELQKRLIAEGFLVINAPTNYFGKMTFTAVKAYQKAHGIEQVGNIGPKTRAMLNGGSGSSMNNTDKDALIAKLKAQLQVLLAKIAALMAAGTSTTSSSTSTSTGMVSTSTPMTGTSTPTTTNASSTTQIMATSTPVTTSTSTATSTQH